MKLEYPKYEILFALQDERDEALPVVRMIMEKYPDVTARIIIGTLFATLFIDSNLPQTTGKWGSIPKSIISWHHLNKLPTT